MTTAFVLGNGVSRQTIDPAQLRTFGPVYGCNALYRTFAPDVLISTDRPISEAIQNSGYSQSNQHYTRRPIENSGAQQIPAEYYGYSSGPVAVALAAEHRHSTVYLLGFDLGPSSTGTFNNVYADTEFYKKSSQPPTYTGNWVRQIVDIVKKFKSTNFIRVCGDTSAAIDDFQNLTNFTEMRLELFANRINNAKDL
jgi:hypothetical protein